MPVRGDALADLGAADPDRLTVTEGIWEKGSKAGEVSKNAAELRLFPPIPTVEKVTDGCFQSGWRSMVQTGRNGRLRV